MTNSKFIILLILFAIMFKAQQIENLKITYKHNFKYNIAKQDIEQELFILLINTKNKESIYYSKNKFISDSLYAEINSGNSVNKSIEMEIPESNFNFEVKKNLLTNKQTYVEQVNGKNYSFVITPDTDWRMTKSEKIILGYHCKGAIIKLGNREWIAYYTSDIPFQDGPYKFFGLPGLILEVGSTDFEHIIQALGIEKTTQKPTSNYSDIIKIKNYNVLLNLKKNYLKDPSGAERAEDSKYNIKEMVVNGQKMNLTETYDLLDREAREFTDKYNNPIEKGDIWVP